MIKDYSVRRLLTGLVNATPTAWKLTVMTVISITIITDPFYGIAACYISASLLIS